MATITVGTTGDYLTIQDAITAANTGDTIEIAAGTYSGNVVVDKEVTLVGDGEVNLVGTFKTDNGLTQGDSTADFLKGPGSTAYTSSAGNGITIAADNVTITNINVSSYSVAIELGDGIDNVTLNNVDIDGSLTGIRKGTEADVTDLAINGGSITDGYHGATFNKTTTLGQENNGLLDGVVIDGMSFSNLVEKGLYFEALSNATITDITMTNVGEYGRTPAFGGTVGNGNFGGFGAGIDINLKNGSYSDITISDFTFTDVGSSNRDGAAPSSHGFGAAIAIKARDDAPSYSGAPASFTGEIVVENGTIDGTSVGVRVGEPGKNVSDPDVSVSNVEIDNETVADFDNVSQSTLEVVGTEDADDYDVSSTATGDVEFDGLGGNDSFTSGAGDDSLDGGAGDDTLDGGTGIDTAEYTGDVSVSHDGTDWVVDGGATEGTDTLSNVEVVNDGEAGNTLLVGDGGYATIQDAIDAAGEGDTIMIAAGTYAENLVIDKGLTIIGQGEVVISPASGNTITIDGDLDGANVTIQGVEIVGTSSLPNQGIGVFVDHGADVGTLTLDNVDIHGAGSYGVFVYGDDESSATPATNTVGEVVITNSDFSNNGFNGANGSAHIKLFGFDGDATLSGLTLAGGTGGVGAGNVANLPDFGIEITGISNTVLTQTQPNSGPAMGTITIDDVTVTGDYHKNTLAVFNFGNVDGLAIDNVDLSGAVTNWGPVLNFDGIAGGVDVSGYDLTLPNTTITAELQGEKAQQGSVDSEITGGAANELLSGKTGNDTLNGGAGNDVVSGGTGTDTAEYNTPLAQSEITFNNATNTWTVNNGTDGTDTLTGVEKLTDGTNDYLLVGGGSEYDTVAEAEAAAEEGDIIVIAPPTASVDGDADANTVAENAAAGTEVGIDANATYLGSGSGITYSLTDPTDGGFQIDANTGVVTVLDGSKIDFEAGDEITLTVSATNGIGGTSSQDFVVNVTNTAPALAASLPNVNEGTTTVGSVASNAGDTTGVSYFLAGADAALFNISAAGVLSFKNAPNFEAPADANSDGTYQVLVTADDGTSPVAKNYSFSVNNLDLSDVIDTNGALNAVAEGVANGTTVGVTALGTDGAGGAGATTYSITSGNNDGAFTINASTGVITVADGTKLDFETLTSRQITVQAQLGATVETETFTINIQDVLGATIEGNNTNDTINGTQGVPDPQAPGEFKVATTENDTINGLGGDDAIDGLAGNDRLLGGKDNDTLRGDDGNDTLIGGTGIDMVQGGAGNDRIFVSGTCDSTDVIHGNAGTDRIAVQGTTDVMLSGINSSGGGAGARGIEVWDGNGQGLVGTDANNQFNFANVTVTDLAFIDGGAGNDVIVGSDTWAGRLLGGDGRDTLTGGDLNDRLTGGSGTDTFVFTGGVDHIMDWTVKFADREHGSDDLIDLRSFGFDDFTDFQTSVTMTQQGGNVRIAFGGGDTLIVHGTTVAQINSHDQDFLFV